MWMCCMVVGLQLMRLLRSTAPWTQRSGWLSRCAVCCGVPPSFPYEYCRKSVHAFAPDCPLSVCQMTSDEHLHGLILLCWQVVQNSQVLQRTLPWPSSTSIKLNAVMEVQCYVLQAALSSELVLIQGPPGTGKSHVGIQLVKILTANTCSTPAAASKHQLEHPKQPLLPVIGPIRIVCLTNHALDQFLEALHDAGIRDIVRVGTGCVFKPHYASMCI